MFNLFKKTKGEPGLGDKIDLVNFPSITNSHTLVVGGHGGSKDYVAIGLALSSLKENVELYISDFHGASFREFDGAKKVKRVEVGEDGAHSLLQEVTKEMNDRYDLFRKEGARTLSEYNKISKAPLPTIVLLINNLDLVMENKECWQMIESILKIGMPVGVYLLSCVQRQPVDKEFKEVLWNAHNKIGVGPLSKSRSIILFGSEDVEEVPANSFASFDINDCYYIKSTPLITFEEVEEYLNKL